MTIRPILRAAALAVGLCVSAAGTWAGDRVKVVYHFSEGLPQADAGLRNIKNHLAADPGAQIVAVSHSRGIDFLLEGAEDKNKNPYALMVEQLADKGVEFRVCNNTLQSRNIDASKVIAQGRIVPSGVAEVARLQAKEGYAYLKP